MPRSKSASQLPKLQVYKRVDEGVGGGGAADWGWVVDFSPPPLLGLLLLQGIVSVIHCGLWGQPSFLAS